MVELIRDLYWYLGWLPKVSRRRYTRSKVTYFVSDFIEKVLSDLAYGVVLYEIVTRKKPWEGIDIVTASHKVVEGETMSIPSECPLVLAEIMKMCWNCDPSMRPDFGEILTQLKVKVDPPNSSDSEPVVAHSSSSSSSGYIRVWTIDIGIYLAIQLLHINFIHYLKSTSNINTKKKLFRAMLIKNSICLFGNWLESRSISDSSCGSDSSINNLQWSNTLFMANGVILNAGVSKSFCQACLLLL